MPHTTRDCDLVEFFSLDTQVSLPVFDPGYKATHPHGRGRYRHVADHQLQLPALKDMGRIDPRQILLNLSTLNPFALCCRGMHTAQPRRVSLLQTPSLRPLPLTPLPPPPISRLSTGMTRVSACRLGGHEASGPLEHPA